MSTAVRCGVGLTVAALGLVACSSGGSVQTLDGAPNASGSGASTPSAGVSVQPTAPAVIPSGTTMVLVLRAYQGYWAAQVRALDSGTVTGSGLQTYATGAALSAAYSDSFRLGQDGLLMAGTPRSNPQVTGLGPEPGQPGAQSATITDCLDVTAWHQIDSKTRQLRDPAKRLTRYPVHVTARTVGGVWMISETRSETGKTC
ncbi:hypothetical protein [Streptacidiphilus sp. MAP12-16]|uniref:hypothetical protein n=1 Tax=Streptacidiphilus sp. MAP12-16 TaxID=3156300 RepID=UPI00351161A0